MPDRDTVVNEIKKIVCGNEKLSVLEHAATVVDGMSTIPRLEIDATKRDYVIVWFNLTGKNVNVKAPFGKLATHKDADKRDHPYLFVGTKTAPPAKTYTYKLSWEEKSGVWKDCDGRHSDPEIIVR